MQPLTNCAFNKAGDQFVTGSFDATCKVWSTDSGELLMSLKGHKKTVYSVAFNTVYG